MKTTEDLKYANLSYRDSLMQRLTTGIWTNISLKFERFSGIFWKWLVQLNFSDNLLLISLHASDSESQMNMLTYLGKRSTSMLNSSRSRVIFFNVNKLPYFNLWDWWWCKGYQRQVNHFGEYNICPGCVHK